MKFPYISEQSKYLKVCHKSAVLHIVVYSYVTSDHEQSRVLLLLYSYE